MLKNRSPKLISLKNAKNEVSEIKISALFPSIFFESKNAPRVVVASSAKIVMFSIHPSSLERCSSISGEKAEVKSRTVIARAKKAICFFRLNSMSDAVCFFRTMENLILVNDCRWIKELSRCLVSSD